MKLRSLFVVSLALTLLPAALGATSLTVHNFSFENPVLAEDAYTTGSIPQWTGAGPFGVLHPLPTGTWGLSPIPDGHNVAWLNQAWISQTLPDAVVTPGMTYTLKVAVGRWEWHTTMTHWYTIQLMAGSNVLESISGDPYLIPQHTFVEEQLSYTVNPSDPNIGKQLTIFLQSGYAETDWDNVRLDAVRAVPVPPSLLLLGSGIVGLAGLRLRHRSS